MWGLLLAVRILVTVNAAADHISQLRPLGELLGGSRLTLSVVLSRIRGALRD
jgi:hypothetical protein